MLIAKLLKSVKHELMEEEIFLFEKDENVLFCRGQNLCPQQSQEFSSFRRRHHCRHCGGIFCDSCLRSKVAVPNGDGTALDYCCIGCAAGRTPGGNIRNCIEERVRSIGTGSSNPQFDKDLSLESRFPATSLSLQGGSPFDKKLIGKAESSVPSVPPSKGFFEFCNKSESAIALKVLVRRESSLPFSVLWEVCRPLYVSVPPQESTHAYFPEDSVDLILIILHSNPNPTMLPDLTYQQANPSLSPAAAVEYPKCCQIAEFRHYSAVAVRTVGQNNVLLKFKGVAGKICDIEPRVGSSMQRVGVFTKMMKTAFGSSSSSSSSSKSSSNSSGGEGGGGGAGGGGEGNGGARGGGSSLDFSTNISAAAIEFLHSSIR